MTISEIAKKANVSIGTVDRVIHNRGRVSKETEQLVRKIIAESNFEPNQYAKSLKLNKRYRFGVLLPEFKEGENSYWEIMRSGCMAAAEDNHFHPSELVFAYFDGTTNLDLQASGEKLLTQDLDGIVFPANSESGTRFLLEKIRDIPYAFVNSGCTDGKPIIDTSQDGNAAGRTAARILSLLCPEGRRFLILKRDTQSGQETMERINSFIDFFETNENVRVVVDTINRKSNLKDQIKAIIDKYQRIDGIFIVNTDAAAYTGCIYEIAPELRPKIVGFDAVQKNVEMLMADKISCLLSQQPFQQGYNAVQQMYLYHVSGKKESVVNRAPVTVLFKENLHTFQQTDNRY